jgi:Protein of unknown function (DUF3626)
MLDDYIEAHVHDPVRIDRDVEALVLDPCYRGTGVEAAAERLPCAVEWHGGSLDPKVIGDAVATGRHDPQALKRVWHYVARFGFNPRTADAP